MTSDLETLVRRELDHVAGLVHPTPEWTAGIHAGLDSQRRASRRRQLGLVAAVAAAVAAITVVASYQPNDRVQPAPRPAENGLRLVDIGGRSMSVDCRGHSAAGAPTVVLDAALGGHPEAYDDVRAGLVSDMRVCTYDRAGTGRSHAADLFPRTARTVSDDLARLVDAGGLGPSIVLVTDGFSALSAAVFAGDHPDLVSGLVFIAPRGPHVTDGEVEALGARRRGEPALVTDLRVAYASDTFSRNGEQISWPRSEEEVRSLLDTPGPAFGGTPTVVLVPELGFDALPSLPTAMRHQWWDVWRADQRLLASESVNGRLREVAGAVRSLATTAPGEVVRAVRDVVDLAASS